MRRGEAPPDFSEGASHLGRVKMKNDKPPAQGGFAIVTLGGGAECYVPGSSFETVWDTLEVKRRVERTRGRGAENGQQKGTWV